jgi:N-acetylmuramoyl-L-alanine amidase
MDLPRTAAANRTCGRALALLVALAWLASAAGVRAAEAPRVLRVRHFSAPDHTRIVLDLDRAASFEVRRVENPDRIAINIPGAVFDNGDDRPIGDALVRGLRCNVREDRAQIVIDIVGRREFRAFSLAPVAGKPDRIVIDILRTGGALRDESPSSRPLARDSVPADAQPDGGVPAPADAVTSPVAAAAAAREVPLVAVDEPAETAIVAPDSGARSVAALSATTSPDTGKVAAADTSTESVESPATASFDGPVEPFVVVIDPGHGGDDPGAIRGNLFEKDICLDIGREVARQLRKLPGYRVVLTRDRDKFLALGKRVEIARREKGDVFVSIHCNTHPKPAVSGTEVYFVSLQGATDREARELADKENAAGLVGLAPGEDHADLVVDILMDLKMTRVLQDSGRLAASLLTAADRTGVVTGRRVKQAGFQVLKTLAMPSALVEVAYLSNPDDARLLADPEGRRKIAGALVAGIEDWRAGTVPQRERTARVVVARGGDDRWDTVYKVRSGDSLWELAARYGTTMNEIARRNNLTDRQRELRIGQRLHLPGLGVRQ